MKRFTLVLLAIGVLFVATSFASLYHSIWVGQSIYAGEFQVWTANGTTPEVMVWIHPINGWKITESHVEIVTDPNALPTNNGGNPVAGQFRWSQETAPTTGAHLYSIPFDDIAPGLAIGDPVVIAIHCVMVKMDMGVVVQDETGWGGPCGLGWSPGDPLPVGFYKWGGSRWGYYFDYFLGW